MSKGPQRSSIVQYCQWLYYSNFDSLTSLRKDLSEEDGRTPLPVDPNSSLSYLLWYDTSHQRPHHPPCCYCQPVPLAGSCRNGWKGCEFDVRHPDLIVKKGRRFQHHRFKMRMYSKSRGHRDYVNEAESIEGRICYERHPLVLKYSKEGAWESWKKSQNDMPSQAIDSMYIFATLRVSVARLINKCCFVALAFHFKKWVTFVPWSSAIRRPREMWRWLWGRVLVSRPHFRVSQQSSVLHITSSHALTRLFASKSASQGRLKDILTLKSTEGDVRYHDTRYRLML